MNSTEIKTEIARLEAQILTNEAEAGQLVTSGNDWIADGKNDKIRSGSKKAGDEQERDRKINLGNSFLAKAAQLRKTNDSIRKTIDTLKEQLGKAIEAENSVKTTLSQQGQTIESVKIIAEGAAEAQKINAAAVGEVEMRKAVAETEETKKNSSTNRMIMIVVALVVVGLGTWFAISKLKKK